MGGVHVNVYLVSLGFLAACSEHDVEDEEGVCRQPEPDPACV